ncbi:SPARC-like [Artemia franciscana]|uniref:SPARC/Testican calcium-binding domain-containing protein n=1 Tax=Artemia franciscana TaxID=6661 RepID=A0AA88IDP7_ARTSF|nr:hypothetical protein QYM36_000001 [Artemia franciscana]
MKGKWLLFLVLIGLIVLSDAAEKKRRRKHKKVEKSEAEPSSGTGVSQDIIDMMTADEENVRGGYDQIDDPCAKKRCGAGKECKISDSGEAECRCVESCLPEVDDRRKVCTNHNETFNSDCELYRMRCLCTTGSQECLGPKYSHAHIEYYGECRDMPECTEQEMDDFPRRMRDWLFNIMRDLAARHELSPHYLKLEKEAEVEQSKRWANAAIWKFCDLDGHPHDRKVSRHELFPIKAPLMALEHCISPFLNKCDVDDDHFITLREWGKCLEIPEDELEDKCEDVRGVAFNEI